MIPKVHNKYHKTAPPGAVYIGRPSPWGNPFDNGTQEEKVINHYRWVTDDNQSELRERMRKELRDKHLVCFCKPKPCHGDILLVIANSTEGPTISCTFDERTPMPFESNQEENGNEQEQERNEGS